MEVGLDHLDDYVLAVEFRNVSWFKEGPDREMLAKLREWNLPLVTVDEPQGHHSSMPFVPEATLSELAVVRFHGRNEETWMKKGITAAERFNYLYSEEELNELAGQVTALSHAATRVHAMFNNFYEDKAVQNARQFLDLLAGR